ncbi:MAG: GspE/PulE/PilB domain-containing protein [Ktedonobacteraceae bacterium]
MGNEAASRLATGAKTDEYEFAIIETMSPVVATIQDITAMGISQVAMVTITLRFEQGAKARVIRQESDEQTTITLLAALRKMVRRTDSVFLLDNTMFFLLLGANLSGGEIVQSRLWDALLWRIHHSDEGELVRPQCLMIGHSAYPAPCTDVYEFLVAASQPALRFELFAEKQTRKQLAHQAQQTQQQVDEDELSSLARKLGIPYLSLLPRKPSQRVRQLVNPSLAQELRCYPIGRERNILTVAMLDPQDQAALARLQQETGLHIFPVLTHPQELQTALEQLL